MERELDALRTQQVRGQGGAHSRVPHVGSVNIVQQSTIQGPGSALQGGGRAQRELPVFSEPAQRPKEEPGGPLSAEANAPKPDGGDGGLGRGMRL